MASHAKPTTEHARVFLSFRHQDAELARALQSHGSGELEIYSFPYDRAPAGHDWRELVRGLIDTADAVVCVVGPTTASSSNVAWELREAAVRQIPVFLAGPGASAFAAARDEVTLIDGATPDEILAALRSEL